MLCGTIDDVRRAGRFAKCARENHLQSRKLVGPWTLLTVEIGGNNVITVNIVNLPFDH